MCFKVLIPGNTQYQEIIKYELFPPIFKIKSNLFTLLLYITFYKYKTKNTYIFKQSNAKDLLM